MPTLLEQAPQRGPVRADVQSSFAGWWCCLHLRLLLLLLCVLAPLPARLYEIVDVQSIELEGDPEKWVRAVEVPADPQEVTCDILVAGA